MPIFWHFEIRFEDLYGVEYVLTHTARLNPILAAIRCRVSVKVHTNEAQKMHAMNRDSE